MGEIKLSKRPQGLSRVERGRPTGCLHFHLLRDRPSLPSHPLQASLSLASLSLRGGSEEMQTRLKPVASSLPILFL